MEPITGLKREYDEILNGCLSDPLKFTVFKGLASKIFVLAAASYLETELVNLVCGQLNVRKNEKCVFFNFAKRKGVSRQYHTWFDWKKSTAVDFFALFGDDFKAHARSVIDANEDFKETEKTFMEIGSKRNILMHNNFVSFSIDLDYDESFALCIKSLKMIDLVGEIFSGYQMD